MAEEPEQTTDDGRIVHCDKCGKALRRFDPVYSVAFDEEKALGRHYDCHKKMQDEFTSAVEKFKDAEGRVKSTLAELRKILR